MYRKFENPFEPGKQVQIEQKLKKLDGPPNIGDTVGFYAQEHLMVFVFVEEANKNTTKGEIAGFGGRYLGYEPAVAGWEIGT
jgi:hypothetical protein